MQKYEAIIIGGGGGLKLRPIANMGHKIAIIEKEDLGGTCLNRGCIPSKMLIHPAEILCEIENLSKHNINVDAKVDIDFKGLIERVTGEVSSTSKSIESAYEENDNIDFYHGAATFVEDKVVEVNGEQLTANKIFIATGSRPFVPDIKGLEGTPFWTSREALRNTKLPKKLIVVGGGYIGMELGYFYSVMGAEVHYVVRSEVLRNEDREVVDEYMKIAEGHGRYHVGVNVEEVSYDDGFSVKLDNGEIIDGDALLVATGVVPNSESLGLENTDVGLSDKGFVEVDDRLMTNVDGVYALGDVVGNYFFRHSVNFEGEYLLRNLYESPSGEPIRYPEMPHAVFGHPQIGGVGKTEEELISEGLEYVKGVNYYKDSAMGGDVLQSEAGLVKLLFDKKDLRLIGAHIVGEDAATMIHICIPFINFGKTLDDMLNMIYVHPAFPEVIRNAARKAKSFKD